MRRSGLWLLPAAAVLIAAAGVALAQGPFGVATPDTPRGLGWAGPFAGLFAWIAARQAAFYRALVEAIGRLKEEGSAFWLLAGLSFVYGVLHAAGPGHGKAVITAYLLSTGETARRGVAIAFAAALLQAIVAILLVAIGGLLLKMTATSMTAATDWLEIGSYGLITAIGAVLLARQLRGHGHHGHGRHDHDHDHLPPPELLRGRFGLRRAAAAIAAVGVRPCSGAVIVLVFAGVQGLFLAGIAATLVMAFGTGLAVAVLAVVAISARGLALRLTGDRPAVMAGLARGVGVFGAIAILLLGLMLLGGKLAAGLPV